MRSCAGSGWSRCSGAATPSAGPRTGSAAAAAGRGLPRRRRSSAEATWTSARDRFKPDVRLSITGRMTRVDTTHVYGIERLRHEYLRRHPGGGDFKAFLQRFQALREAVHGRHDPVRFYHLTFADPDGKSRGVAAAHAARQGGTRAALGAEGDDGDVAGEVSPSLPQ